MTRNHFWYAPVPPDFGSSRVTLHFGLRSDDIYYRNLVVPEAGRVWFLRELSWSLGALMLAKALERDMERRPGPVAVAHALEAVGCKLAWRHERVRGQTPEAPRRVTGRRAFERDFEPNERWAFSELSRPENYVVNTHRQAVMGALRSGTGLGLVAGRHFASMAPVGRGAELGRAFLDQPVGKGRGRLETRLREWIGADPNSEEEFLDHQSTFRALASTTASEAERVLVERILFDGGHAAAQKRRALRDAFGSAMELPAIEGGLVPALESAGRRLQANEIRAARAFGSVLDTVVEIAFATHAAMGSASAQRPADVLVRDARVADALEALGTRLRRHAELAAIAGTTSHARETARLLVAIESADLAERLLVVLRRGERLFEVERTEVSAGPLFDRLERTDGLGSRDASPGESVEPGSSEGELGRDSVASDRTFYLEGFHQLVSDCRGGDGSEA